MKKLVTADDVRKYAETRKKTLYIEPDTIITPAAKDAADELDICIAKATGRPQPAPEAPPVSGTQWKAAVDADLVAKIVKEVMAALTGSQPEMIKEADPSGLRLIKGNTVVYEKFNTGKTGDRVRIKEILTKKESPHLAAGFMTIENTGFLWDLKCEELNYIIEGTLDVTINGTTYRGEAGDVFYLPGETTAEFSTPGEVKLFYITYPRPAGIK